jgi:hypothetical protein
LKRFRFRPTYSNVVATLALFFALAGGAWAATQLPKESVGSTQLAKGAVTPAKLSDQAKKGFTGARGEAGAQGALGPRGNEGPRGENGAAGATGPQGIRGATGATGTTGSPGVPGEIGLRGERGLTGQLGPTGPQGDQGLTGPTGLRGEPGEIGLRGERGERGPMGERGEKGDTGQQGQRGMEGPTGPEGDPGPEGPQGLEGHPGSEGKQGDEGQAGPTGPSDAYFDVSEAQADEIADGSKGPQIPLEVKNLPAGEYVLQAALTVQGGAAPALAECKFGGEGSGISIGTSESFRTNLTQGNYASLDGITTAVVTEPSAAYVACEAAEAETSFLIPAESGHLTATMVGRLHPPTP